MTCEKMRDAAFIALEAEEENKIKLFSAVVTSKRGANVVRTVSLSAVSRVQIQANDILKC